MADPGRRCDRRFSYWEDHRRLDALLQATDAHPRPDRPRGLRSVPCGSAEAYRHGGKTVVACIATMAGGEPLPVAARLRLDHGALATLLMPTPDRSDPGATIRRILSEHNRIEEGP